MSRIGDAFWTLLRPGWDRRIRELEAELRELTLEVTGALETLNAWAAKQYKREYRAARAQLVEPVKAADEVRSPTDVATSMARRGSIIRRALAQRGGVKREPDVMGGEE